MTPEYEVLKDTTLPCRFTGTDSLLRLIIIGWPGAGGSWNPSGGNTKDSPDPKNAPAHSAAVKEGMVWKVGDGNN